MARVRFAPSPTGMLHLGGARTALFNYLYARNTGGSFVLRIEDTDKDRNVSGSIKNLQDSLQWLGLKHDEGPVVGGSCGPYIQSERLSLYRQHAEQLVRLRKAYPCFCSQERLKTLRSSTFHPAGYDGFCRTLSERQVQEKLQMGTPYVIRLMAPRSGSTEISDEVYGSVLIANSEITDQVLLRSDGLPTYHLAVVVDDHHMDISHVLRGKEFLMSTAKHLLLYSAFNWTPPIYAHLPLLVSSSGKKLSKRNDAVFVEHYKDRGFQPESVVNMLALLGWHPHRDTPPDLTATAERDIMSTEVYSMDELISSFSLSEIRRTPAVLDESKLMWLNKHHYRQKLRDTGCLSQLAADLKCEVCKLHGIGADDDLVSDHRMKEILLLLEDRISLIPATARDTAYFWKAPSISSKLFDSAKIADRGQCLSLAKRTLSECDFEDLAALNDSMRQMAAELNISFTHLMLLLRLAIAGSKSTPGLAAVMQNIGRETVVQRLDNAITVINDCNNVVKL